MADFYPENQAPMASAQFNTLHFRAFPVFIAVFIALLWGCGNPHTPLDAGTRQKIDSLTALGINSARKETDSLCLLQQTTVLPGLVDSIRKKRLREIERQLKTVPK